MQGTQVQLSRQYSDVRIKEEEHGIEHITPPAPEWSQTSSEDQSFEIDQDLLDAIHRPTKRAKRNRKGEALPRNTSTRSKGKARQTAQAAAPVAAAAGAGAAYRDVDDTVDEDAMPMEGPAFDFSQLMPGQTLAREQLLVMCTSDFDVYMKHVTAHNDISPEELQDLKNIRRRIRNRESARESRSNKKDYVDKLQNRVETLKNHNKSLSLQIHGMQSENQSLKDEVVFLQDMIKKTPALENLFNALLYISNSQQSSSSSSTGSAAPAFNLSSLVGGPIVSAANNTSQPTPINVSAFLAGQEPS